MKKSEYLSEILKSIIIIEEDNSSRKIKSFTKNCSGGVTITLEKLPKPKKSVSERQADALELIADILRNSEILKKI